MRYRFDGFELDTQRFVLRTSDREIHVEPLVFDLLRFLVEHAGEVVTREAIIEQVWEGRIVSDATVSSCIKSVRKALGDDGAQQRHLRTIRARGFQFTASVECLPAAAAATTAATVRQELACAAAAETTPKIPPPPRIAVLPLFPLPQDPELGLLGDALAQEVILELSRLHWLAVIARGSTFKFRGQEIDLAQAGQILGATYILTGTIMRHARSCVVAVELCRAADSDVVWAERFTTPTAELMHMRSVLAGKIVASLEPRVQHSEAVQAAHVPTEELDAWAAYHRGIMHMYRFNQHDNALAAQLFARSVSVDPGFARGHAGLSFTHFQNAFLGFSADVEGEVQRAHAQASRSLELDSLDPFANLSMGRAEWLCGNLEGSLPWIERSTALSPNYAFAIYNSALVGTLLGEGESSEARVARAMTLSPIDPLSYAMLATRALTHCIRGNHAMAAVWADRAVKAPNAHIQIYTIAAIANELIGERSKAAVYVDHIRRAHPGYGMADFVKSFPFRDPATQALVRQALQRLGL
jgi:DNA-binding winged helix-turn-helix (wHTH) protein/tetratricopeptide (TPR) repeat protein